jgi:adhesin/invasin
VLRYVSGDGQTGPAGTALANALAVELVDQLGAPVAGEAIAFTAKGGGTVAAPSVVTAANGRATTTWTLGPAKGAQEVVATAAGTVFAVSFHATSV